MFKFTVLFALIACVAANHDIIANSPLTYATPAPIVTTTSSQVIARNYNGVATAPIVAAAPGAVPVVARYAAAAPLPASLASPHYVAPFAAAYLFW